MLLSQYEHNPDLWSKVITDSLKKIIERRALECSSVERRSLMERHCTGLRMLYRDAFRPSPPRTQPKNSMVSLCAWYVTTNGDTLPLMALSSELHFTTCVVVFCSGAEVCTGYYKKMAARTQLYFCSQHELCGFLWPFPESRQWWQCDAAGHHLHPGQWGILLLGVPHCWFGWIQGLRTSSGYHGVDSSSSC